MRQILLFAALAASLALLSGCALSKAKADTAEDMADKALEQPLIVIRGRQVVLKLATWLNHQRQLRILV